jgi:hypothetical protein
LDQPAFLLDGAAFHHFNVVGRHNGSPYIGLLTSVLTIGC